MVFACAFPGFGKFCVFFIFAGGFKYHLVVRTVSVDVVKLHLVSDAVNYNLLRALDFIIVSAFIKRGNAFETYSGIVETDTIIKSRARRRL